jgi:hypothetical protein
MSGKKAMGSCFNSPESVGSSSRLYRIESEERRLCSFMREEDDVIINECLFDGNFSRGQMAFQTWGKPSN